MTFDVSDGYVLLYGGYTGTVVLSDTWTFFNGTWTNITASVTGHPPADTYASLAFDPSTSKVILFGGVTLSGDLAQTWTYHAKTWTNITSTAGTSPSPRWTASMATDSTDDEVVLVGGYVSGPVAGTAHDTWTFHDGTWTNVTAVAPIPAYLELPTISDDPAAGGVLLTSVAANVSGYTPPFYAAMFLYHGGAWENRTTFGPTAPPLTLDEESGMTYLPSLSSVVLVAGAVFTTAGGGVDIGVTWENSGGTWLNLTPRVTAGPGEGSGFGVATNPIDNTVLVFGGFRISAGVSSTWALSAPPSVTASSSPTVTDVGVNVAFSGTISYGIASNHPTWKFGDGASSSTELATHSYSTAGTFKAVFSANDLAGQNASAFASVAVNARPTAVATIVPTSPTVGSSVGLFASLTGGTGPFTYAWTLGDGTTASTATVAHTYSSAGPYKVSLVVTDSVGQSAFSNVSLSVGSAPAGSSVSLTSGTGFDLLLLAVVLLVVVIALAVLLMRKGRPPRGPPTQYDGAPAGAVPPGASGPASGGGPPPPA